MCVKASINQLICIIDMCTVYIYILYLCVCTYICIRGTRVLYTIRLPGFFPTCQVRVPPPPPPPPPPLLDKMPDIMSDASNRKKKLVRITGRKYTFICLCTAHSSPRLISWNETQSWAPWQNGGNSDKNPPANGEITRKCRCFSLHVLIIEKRELDSRVAI